MQGLYDSFHLNFVSALPRPLLEQLAQGTVAATCAQRVAKVYDQYLAFSGLEASLFSLGLPHTYLQLNDPAAQDAQIGVRLGVCMHSACQCEAGSPASVLTTLEAAQMAMPVARPTMAAHTSRQNTWVPTLPMLAALVHGACLEAGLHGLWPSLWPGP